MDKRRVMDLTYLPTIYESRGHRAFVLAEMIKDMRAAGKKLTFNTDYLIEGYRKKSYMETPWKEIKLKPVAKNTPGNLHKKQTPLPLEFHECVALLKEAIKSYLKKAWNPNSKKVFLHSAGYDSRIISGCLVELREEMGQDWIGDLHFRCHQPEGEVFKKIMRAEGWTNYSLWEDVHGMEDHYNLGRLEPVNGFMSFYQQYDFFSDFPKDTILISGMFGGELFDYPSRGKKHFTDFKYCDNELLRSLHNYMLYEGGTVSKYFHDYEYAIFPFLSYEYLKVATRMPSKYITRDQSKPKEYPDAIREALLKSFSFDILSQPYVRHDYHWNISHDRWMKMAHWYEHSKFANDFEITLKFPFNGRSYDDMMWTLSLLYELT